MKPSQRAALFTATALTTLGLSGTAFAQDAVDLGTLTLSANRGESTELARSGVTVEVVTKEDLEQSGETLLADYLATLPGVSVTSNGGIGGNATLRIRGLEGAYIGVYIDGIDVNDPSNTQTYFDFGSLTTTDVSRVEVLKGSQSALYGSEAIAGVINITTARPTEPGLSQNVAAEFGTYNTAKLSYNLGYLGSRGSVAATLSRIATDGFSAADENDGNDEADSHEATRLSFAGDYALTETVTLGGSGFWQTSDTEYDTYDPGLSDGTTLDDEAEAESYGLRIFADIDGELISHQLSAQYYEMDRESTGTTTATEYDAYDPEITEGDILPFSYPYWGQRWSLGYQGQAELSSATLTFGADATRERYENDEDDGEQELFGLWAQADWHLGEQFELVTALRHDEHSEFGGESTGRLSLAYLPRPDITLRASLGTGFRAPSLYELHSSEYGNSDLGPETSVSYELGVEKRYESAQISATFFRNEITDLIRYQTTNFVTYEGNYEQVDGTSWTQGIELKGGAEITDTLRIAGSYTWTDSEDAESGEQLIRVPLYDAALSLNADITEAFRAGVTVRHVAGMTDSTGDLDDYTVTNMNLRYALSDQAELYLRVENLFDEEYQVLDGYGTSDRAAYFGVRARF